MMVPKSVCGSMSACVFGLFPCCVGGLCSSTAVAMRCRQASESKCNYGRSQLRGGIQGQCSWWIGCTNSGFPLNSDFCFLFLTRLFGKHWQRGLGNE